MNKWTVYPQGYHWRVTEPRELFQHTLAVLADPPLDPEAAARAAQAVAGDSAKTDFFLIAGSITSSREGMERFLTPLLQTAKPVLILAGSSPPREEYLTAAANLSSRFGNLINLNRVRRFETQLLAILSAPGVYGEGREDVCAWGDKHPMGLKHLIAQSPLPVLLAGSDLFEPAAGELSAAPAIRKPMQELLASKPVPFVVSASAAPRPGAFDGKGKPVLGEAIPGGQAAAGRLADGWYLLAVYHSNGSMNFTARPIK
ncbi:MAG: hypothetical protein GMKNLPBB_01138 [Myxococcota bacterium]|nr:hypothetical protein [Myxococcota bacterium]